MFDKDMHKEYLFLRYLLHLLPAEPADPCDLEGKLKLEYYKLQKTFEGAIQLEELTGVYEPAKQKAVGGKQKKTPLDEILEQINEKYKGQFTDADKVIIDALHQKLKKNAKLLSSAKTTDPVIFTESIFPQIFSPTAMENYTESQESYESLFKDKNKYNAIMSALAGVIYREMRTQNTDNHNQ
ncbi:hypothetical protein [Ruminococcus flavefaciens]|uniref:hypothetical protein n=1 Tax=Ruminococcus flavefaciens TaxID=1265 RepID=UPI0026EE3655|nr:hypothetical protein [Ruminococcus flavefaciens]MDD7516463.1 hypothetical protein [Ruminococcus flavefaciens]MDY5690930.1 hypothetical protein [Ruminococcus flavefaciens]